MQRKMMTPQEEAAIQKEERIRTGFYCEKRLLNISDSYLVQANCKSRNEFFNKSIRHYIAYLQKDDDSEFLTPALESVIGGMIADSEDRTARVLFKLAVEMAMLLHVTANATGVTDGEIERLKVYCIDEVKRLNGRINFDAARRYQKG